MDVIPAVTPMLYYTAYLLTIDQLYCAKLLYVDKDTRFRLYDFQAP
jgi:hypothetical protein